MKTTILSLQQCDALSAVQLKAEPANTFDFISSTAAISKNFIQVTELSAGGSVNEICVINNSIYFVFLMDGDILSGAKQNRVINTSILLGPQSKTIIPVSCVESGRWNSQSEKFDTTDYIAPIELRKSKAEQVSYSLKTYAKYASDQGSIWNTVSKVSEKMNVSSDTSNLSDVYEKKSNSYEKFLNAFKANNEANGVAFFINKKLVNIEIFNRSDIFSEYFPKMLKGISMDAFGLKSPGELEKAEAEFKTLDLLDQLETMQMDTHKGVGLGNEKRFVTNDVSGFQLDYNSNLIHFTAMRNN